MNVYKRITKKGLSVIIRYPKQSDLESIHRYFNTLSKERTYLSEQGEHISRSEHQKYLSDKLKRIQKKKTVWFLVFHNNTLIGSSTISLFDKRAFFHVGEFLISIARKYRGKGVGELLLKTVILESKKTLKSLKILILEVFGNNNTAINMYKKFGFKPYGKLPEGVLHRKKYVDDVLMYKRIR